MGEKFRRTDPEERRELLVEAALRCLFKDGRSGLSVRSIAAEAGVSIGLVNHHFGTIEALVAQAYRTLADRSLADLRRAMERAGGSAADQLDAFLSASFLPGMLDPDLLNAWIVFWSLQRSSPAMAATHTAAYGAYIGTLEDLLRRMTEEEAIPLASPRLAAIGLSAMLDGLWLELSLNPSNFSPDEALELCRGWVRGLRNGAYA